MCSTCWSTLESFHRFYQAVYEAKDNYLTKCTNSDNCEDSFDIISHDADMVSCKEEPPEIIEYVEDSQPFANIPENRVSYNFERGHFAPDATIDEQDFDAIFLEEFSNECDIKMEKATPVERSMEHLESNQHTLTAPAKTTTRNRTPPRSSTDKHSPRKSRKGPAEYSSASSSNNYSGNPSSSVKKEKIHHAPIFIPADGAELNEKCVKR